MTEIVVALTTVPADFDAPALARALVDSRVAACVNILPAVRSIYRWQGAIEEADEQQLVIKTTREGVEALWKTLKEHHPYDVPEFIVLPVVEGSPEYLDWVRLETR
jgi:periplasmic divalent cation tolerance protein